MVFPEVIPETVTRPERFSRELLWYFMKIPPPAVPAWFPVIEPPDIVMVFCSFNHTPPPSFIAVQPVICAVPDILKPLVPFTKYTPPPFFAEQFEIIPEENSSLPLSPLFLTPPPSPDEVLQLYIAPPAIINDAPESTNTPAPELPLEIVQFCNTEFDDRVTVVPDTFALINPPEAVVVFGLVLSAEPPSIVIFLNVRFTPVSMSDLPLSVYPRRIVA